MFSTSPTIRRPSSAEQVELGDLRAGVGDREGRAVPDGRGGGAQRAGGVGRGRRVSVRASPAAPAAAAGVVGAAGDRQRGQRRAAQRRGLRTSSVPFGGARRRSGRPAGGRRGGAGAGRRAAPCARTRADEQGADDDDVGHPDDDLEHGGGRGEVEDALEQGADQPPGGIGALTRRRRGCSGRAGRRPPAGRGRRRPARRRRRRSGSRRCQAKNVPRLIRTAPR